MYLKHGEDPTVVQIHAVVVNGFWSMRVTTHSTHIPLIGVHVIPVEAPSLELLRALVELLPNPRVRASSGVHGSVAPRGINRRYVGTKTNEEVEGPHVVSPGKHLQLRLT